MQDYYLALGVSETATESVIKIAYEGKMKALVRAQMSDSERRAEERVLGQAYATLSNPGKREWYDRKREEAEPRAPLISNQALIGGSIALATLLLAVGGWQAHLRGVERKAALAQEARLEEQRAIAAARQQEAEERQQESQAAREATMQARREAEQRRALERDRYEVSSRQTYDSQRARSVAAQQEYQARAEEERQRRTYQQQEERNRYQAAQEQQRAQAEVERQRRGMEQREREEERIRLERHYKAQREAEVNRSRAVAETETGLVPSRTRINKGPGFLPPTY